MTTKGGGLSVSMKPLAIARGRIDCQLSSILLHFALHFKAVLGAKLVTMLLFGGPWSDKGVTKKWCKKKEAK